MFVGAVFPTRPLKIDAEQIVRRLLTIRGLHNYMPEDLAAAIDFLSAAAPQYPFAELVSSPLPLSRVDEAFNEAIAGPSLRVAVSP